MTIIAIIILAIWVAMMFTVVEIRYIFFLWILLYLPAAEILAASLAAKDGLYRIASKGLTAALVIVILLRTFFIAIDTYSPIDSEGNPACRGAPCDYQRPINQDAPRGARVLTLSAFRYYLRTDLFACSTREAEYETLQALSHQSPQAFWEEVIRQGYTYVAYEKEYSTRHLLLGLHPDPAEVPEWMRLIPLSETGVDYAASYRIEILDPSIHPQYHCVQDASGVWTVTAIP
jgi:hypothetical protein